jgi:hypothetical protein
LLANRDRSDPRIFIKKLRAVQTVDLDRLDRRESRFDKKLDSTQIAKARDDTAVTGRVQSCDQ